MNRIRKEIANICGLIKMPNLQKKQSKKKKKEKKRKELVILVRENMWIRKEKLWKWN